MIEGIIVNTLVRGGVYALLALGFSLIFGVARVLQLAHTAFYMIAAYGIFYFADMLGWPPVLSILVSIIVTTGIGLLTYKLVIDRVREHHVTVMLITLAVAIVFQELMLIAFTGQYRSAPSFVEGNFTILGVKVVYQHALIFIGALVVLAIIWLLLSKTRLGIAIRATAQDTEVANLMGINVSTILFTVMGIATALAAVAGVLVAPTLVLEPHMLWPPFVMVMAIITLGGLGSVKGSIIGAFVLALVEVLVVYLLPTGAFLKGAAALLVMVIVLVFRPEGLFGVVFEEERL
ncbi:MAG: branched-chain amino acid ABC transporter permease [Chloroflexota bacterium]|nr:MAG: branched-chain amino acid ABC transporter permease [Chloroflexota bacterium]